MRGRAACGTCSRPCRMRAISAAEGDAVDGEEDAHRHEGEQCRGERPAADRERLGGRLDDGVRLLDVRSVDERRDGRAVGRLEVAGRRLEDERRDDEPPERQAAGEAGDRNRDQHDAADEVGADHQPPPAPAVCGHTAVQPEDDGGDAVGDPDCDHAERAACLECEPHERDVVQ